MKNKKLTISIYVSRRKMLEAIIPLLLVGLVFIHPYGVEQGRAAEVSEPISLVRSSLNQEQSHGVIASNS